MLSKIRRATRDGLIALSIILLLISLSGEALAHQNRQTSRKHDAKHRVINRRQKVARVARSYTGIPYVFGGSSRSGIDCSGLTLRVYGDALGIGLPHSAAAQATFGGHPGWTRRWKPSGFRKGDLVFLKNTYKPGVSHAGVWIGGGRYVAAHSTGTRSSVTTWDSYEESHGGFSIRPSKLRIKR